MEPGESTSAEVPEVGPAAQAPPEQKKGWWGRNWKWFVPVGCLLPSLVVVGCIALGIYGLSMMKEYIEVFEEAVVLVGESEEIREALGDPIEPAGQFKIESSGGMQVITVPMSGPKGRGELVLSCKKVDGKWKLISLVMTVEDTDEKIRLMKNKGIKIEMPKPD